MRVPEAVPQLESQPEDWFGSSFKSTTKLWRLPPWYLHRLQPAENQVNLLLLLLQEQGDIILASTLETRYTTARNTLRSLAHWRSTSCAFPYNYNYNYMSTRKERRVAYSLSSYRRQWNPCHMDFDLVFQQVIDRQDRTTDWGTLQLYWNHYMSHSLEYRNTLPDKDSSHDDDDMPCRHPLHWGYCCSSCYRNDETPSRKPTPRRRQTSHRT